jgi:glycerophosphoryl diester phosphodiesterase
MGFAHRGLHRGPAIAENSLAAFAAALEIGAGIECDLRLTADDRILVFHDADARRLCGSPEVIGRCTAAQLSELRVGGESIPRLEDLLDLVSGRVPLLLEVKVAGDLRRWLAPLQRALAGYAGPFGVMSFEPRVAGMLRAMQPGWRRGLVIAHRLSWWKRRIALRLARPDFLAVETSAATRQWVAGERRKMPVYCWTVRSPADRIALSDRVDALIWEGDGRP